MPAPLRLGLAGLGTVGIGVVKIVQRQADLIAARAGRPIEIVAVSARDQTRTATPTCPPMPGRATRSALARRADIDVFVEVMGGSEGPGEGRDRGGPRGRQGRGHRQQGAAGAAWPGPCRRRPRRAGRSSVSRPPWPAAFPSIKALTEGLAGNAIKRVMGVMNGTCNYILTRMESAGLPYETVFEEARQLGYLEADPNLDVGGIDAGHKLSLLAAIAFGTKVSFDAVELEGIGKISIDDIRHAADMGYRIKLLGVAQMTGRGLEQRMTPCLVPADSPLGQLQGGTNMVVLEGDAVGQIVLRGPGAGEGPTASAVMADVIDLARGIRIPTFGQPATTLCRSRPPRRRRHRRPYYLRMTLLDKPGALAKIATALGEAGVSIDRMRQYGHAGTNRGARC